MPNDETSSSQPPHSDGAAPLHEQPHATGHPVVPPPPAYGPPLGAPSPPTAAYVAPSPASAAPPPAPTRPPALGVSALIVAVVGVVVGALLTAMGGAQLSDALGRSGLLDQGYIDPDNTAVPTEAYELIASATTMTVAGWAVYGVTALVSLLLGIIAIVQRRGRGWGIAAVIVAVLGAVAVLIAMTIGATVGATPYV